MRTVAEVIAVEVLDLFVPRLDGRGRRVTSRQLGNTDALGSGIDEGNALVHEQELAELFNSALGPE